VELRPFRSIRFAPPLVAGRGLAALIAPAHDPARNDFAAPAEPAAPENIARVTAPSGDGEAHQSAAETLKQWLAEGILEKERRPGLWAYRQTFVANGRTQMRDALIGLVRLVEYDRDVLRPHEETPAPARDDRLSLLHATKADFEPALLLTRAPLAQMLSTTRRPSVTGVGPDGVRHDAFRIIDFASHVELQGLVKNAEALVGQGHHLYEASLAFSKSPESAKLPGARYKLCAIVDENAPGVVLRPVHRLLHGVADWDSGRLRHAAEEVFQARPFAGPRQALEALARESRLAPAFVLFAPPAGAALLVVPEGAEGLPWPEGRSEAWRRSDAAAVEVALLARLLLIGPATIERHVSYTTDAERAIAAVEKGEAQAAVLMRPTTISDLEEIVHAGDRLPLHSTSFYPPLFAGLFGVALEDPVY
jgi:uncharacterized protein (DUF1015 family)